MNSKKLTNSVWQCSSCNNKVFFDLIEEIECDWGSHVVIQCPNCEEIFSIDKRCPAFSNLLDLDELNDGLFSIQEKKEYAYSSHPN